VQGLAGCVEEAAMIYAYSIALLVVLTIYRLTLIEFRRIP
jgi:hypothetical protein